MNQTQTHHHRDNTKAHRAGTPRRTSASGARALSVGATIFWAIYPIVWTCFVCFAISRFLGCTVPVAAVTSGSMEPQTYRGDLLLLVGPDFGGPVRVGDIVLYRLPHRPETPIVHRVVDITNGSAYPSGQVDSDARWYLTKGDDNQVDDVGLVAPSFPSGLLPHAALIGTDSCIVPSHSQGLVQSVIFPLIFFSCLFVDGARPFGPITLTASIHPRSTFLSFFYSSFCVCVHVLVSSARAGKVRGQVPLAGYPALLPIGVKIAAAIVCVSWGLRSLLAGAKKAEDIEESAVAAWSWALLVLCPLI